MRSKMTAAALAALAGAAAAQSNNVPNNIPAYIGDSIAIHYPMDNLGDAMIDPSDPAFGVFGAAGGQHVLVNYGKAGPRYGNNQLDLDLNNDFLETFPTRVTGKIGFGVDIFGNDNRFRTAVDANGGMDELPWTGGGARSVSFWMIMNENEISQNEFIDAGPDFIMGTDDDVFGAQSCIIDIGNFTGATVDGNGYAIYIDENDDLELAVKGPRTNGFGGTRPVDFAARALADEWTLVTVVLPDVSDPDITDKGDPGPSLHDVILYADGEVWDFGDTGNNDIPIDTDSNRIILGERSGGNDRFDGRIDDVAVFARGLSQEEIQTIFALANSSLQYDHGEFELLRQVHVGQLTDARIGNLLWEPATGLSGDRVQGFPPNATVILDETAGTGVTSRVAPDGLLVHYSMDQGTDGDAFLANEGITGFQNDAVCVRDNDPENYVFITDGAIGQAMTNIDPMNAGLNQNGNAQVSYGGLTPILGSQERTMSLWVRSSATEFDTPLTIGSDMAFGGTKFDVQITGPNIVEVGAGNGRMLGDDEFDGDPNVRDGQWHLITAVLPSGGSTIGDIEIYLDGEFEYSDTTGADIGNPIQTGPEYGWLYLARNANHQQRGATPGDRYSGDMDDVAVWNVGLTGDQVRGLFQVGTQLQYDASDFEALRQVFLAQSGSVEIDGLTWSYATGLMGPAGLSGMAPNFELVLDAGAGTGLATAPAGPTPCNAADISMPFGQLDLSDVQTFLIGFGGMDPVADIAGGNPSGPDGMFDLQDVQTFLIEFGAGCPN